MVNEIDFKNWLIKKGRKRKVAGDIVSRLKRIEKELNCYDIDEQYHNDKCEYLMSLFLKLGNNDQMKKYSNANFPIGKRHMNTFRYALKQYVMFCEEFISNKK